MWFWPCTMYQSWEQLQYNRPGRPRYYRYMSTKNIATVHCHLMADTVTTTAAYDSTIKCYCTDTKELYTFYLYLYLYYNSLTSIAKARICKEKFSIFKDRYSDLLLTGLPAINPSWKNQFISRKFGSLGFVREKILWSKYLYGADSHGNFNELKTPRVPYQRVQDQSYIAGHRMPTTGLYWNLLFKN